MKSIIKDNVANANDFNMTSLMHAIISTSEAKASSVINTNRWAGTFQIVINTGSGSGTSYVSANMYTYNNFNGGSIVQVIINCAGVNVQSGYTLKFMELGSVVLHNCSVSDLWNMYANADVLDFSNPIPIPAGVGAHDAQQIIIQGYATSSVLVNNFELFDIAEEHVDCHLVGDMIVSTQEYQFSDGDICISIEEPVYIPCPSCGCLCIAQKAIIGVWGFCGNHGKFFMNLEGHLGFIVLTKQVHAWNEGLAEIRSSFNILKANLSTYFVNHREVRGAYQAGYDLSEEYKDKITYMNRVLSMGIFKNEITIDEAEERQLDARDAQQLKREIRRRYPSIAGSWSQYFIARSEGFVNSRLRAMME